MKFDIKKQIKPSQTFRIASVKGKFDLQSEHIEEHFFGEIELPEEWQIGVICGNSGTGKTTIIKELFPDNCGQNYQFKAESILDDKIGRAHV